MAIIKLYKQIGETPLECLKRFKRENTSYEGVSMTYAGRLDPMAEGLLLVLAGEDLKNKDKYLDLDKVYEFEILFGFETDTGDLLGKIIDSPGRGRSSSGFEVRPQGGEFKIRKTPGVEVSPLAGPGGKRSVLEEERSDGRGPTSKSPFDLKEMILPIIKKLKGKFFQEYPAYSSRTVDGKPLWQWAREGRIGELEIPKKEVEIYNLEMVDQKEISSEELKNQIFKKIDLVHGDFRQDEIKKNWQEIMSQRSKFSSTPGDEAGPAGPGGKRSFLEEEQSDGKGETLRSPSFDLKEPAEKFLVFNFKIHCSSGTYVRALTERIGKELGVPACTFSIKRTRIGDWRI